MTGRKRKKRVFAALKKDGTFCKDAWWQTPYIELYRNWAEARARSCGGTQIIAYELTPVAVYDIRKRR